MFATEIRELDDYCLARGIELVPNQNSFGHMERWLRHNAYKHLAESPNGFEHPIAGWRDHGSTLHPCAESLEFIDTLYAELLPNFHSGTINIGCDEPWELGQGLSKQRIAREGKHTVYLEFLCQLLDIAKAHGKHAQFWADIVLERPELVSQLPQHICPVIWGYEADSPSHSSAGSSPMQASPTVTMSLLVPATGIPLAVASTLHVQTYTMPRLPGGNTRPRVSS